MAKDGMNWLIEHGRLIDPRQSIDRVARLLLVDGVVAAIDPSDGDVPHDCQRVDARDCIVAPGLVDLAVELGEPGREEDETIESGTLAALAGGFTSIACTANTDPPIDTATTVEFIRQKAARRSLSRVCHWLCQQGAPGRGTGRDRFAGRSRRDRAERLAKAAQQYGASPASSGVLLDVRQADTRSTRGDQPDAWWGDARRDDAIGLGAGPHAG